MDDGIVCLHGWTVMACHALVEINDSNISSMSCQTQSIPSAIVTTILTHRMTHDDDDE
jgi:hypothetical protein